MLSPGVYKARVVSHVWTTSQTGSPGLAVKVGILGDDFAEETIIGTVWITQKSAGMARQQFKALGLDVDRQDFNDIGNGISLVDNEVEVILEEQEYKGRVNIRVARFGKPAVPPTKEAIAKAQAMMRAAKKKATEEVEVPDVLPFTPDPLGPQKRLAEDIDNAANTPAPEGDIPF